MLLQVYVVSLLPCLLHLTVSESAFLVCAPSDSNSSFSLSSSGIATVSPHLDLLLLHRLDLASGNFVFPIFSRGDRHQFLPSQPSSSRRPRTPLLYRSADLESYFGLGGRIPVPFFYYPQNGKKESCLFRFLLFIHSFFL